jgi:pectinesterase
MLQKCQLHSIANPYGSISAQKRSFPTSNTGYSFVSCVVSGSGYIFLGRAWGPYSRVIFSYTFLSSIIRPEGWDDFGVALNQK